MVESTSWILDMTDAISRIKLLHSDDVKVHLTLKFFFRLNESTYYLK